MASYVVSYMLRSLFNCRRNATFYESRMSKCFRMDINMRARTQRNSWLDKSFANLVLDSSRDGGKRRKLSFDCISRGAARRRKKEHDNVKVLIEKVQTMPAPTGSNDKINGTQLRRQRVKRFIIPRIITSIIPRHRSSPVF